MNNVDPTELVLATTATPGLFRVERVFTYGGCTVPAGFETNFATYGDTFLLKFIGRWLYPKLGASLKAAVVHDYEYFERRYPKSIVDTDFYSNLLAEGMPQWKAKLAHKLVVNFGNSGREWWEY